MKTRVPVLFVAIFWGIILTGCVRDSDENNGEFAYSSSDASKNIVEDSLYLNPEYSENIRNVLPEINVLAVNFNNATRKPRTGNLPPEESIHSAAVSFSRTDYAQTAFYLRRAMIQADSMSLPRRSCFPIFYGLALTYIYIQDYEQADYYLQRAGEFYSKMTPRERFIYLSYAGLNDFYRTDYRKALDKQQEAIRVASATHKMYYEENIGLANMAQTYLHLNHADSALYCLSRSFQYFDSTRIYPAALYYVQTLRMSTALKRGEMETATSIIYSPTGKVEPVLAKQRSSMLIDYYIQINAWRNAYAQLRLDKLQGDSIQSERLRTRIEEINYHYQQDTLAIHQTMVKKAHTSKLIMNTQRLVIIGLIVIIAALLVFFSILYGRKKHQYKAVRAKSDIQEIRLDVVQCSVSDELIEKTKEDAEAQKIMVPLLHRIIADANKLSCTLADEMSIVNDYLSLWQRTDASLHVTCDIDHSLKPEEISLPNRMIQLLIVNSLSNRLKNLKNDKDLVLSVRREGIQTVYKVTDNGGGYVVHQVAASKNMSAVTKIIELLNRNNNNEIEIAFHTVWLRNGEKACETKISIPNDFVFEF